MADIDLTDSDVPFETLKWTSDDIGKTVSYVRTDGGAVSQTTIVHVECAGSKRMKPIRVTKKKTGLDRAEMLAKRKFSKKSGKNRRKKRSHCDCCEEVDCVLPIPGCGAEYIGPIEGASRFLREHGDYHNYEMHLQYVALSHEHGTVHDGFRP